MIDSVKSYFSLKLVERNYFTDVISGLPVNLYKDCFNVVWLKNSRWSFFKVRKGIK